MKYKPIDYLTVYLQYVPNLESNPLPPKELQCDGWNTQNLVDHVAITNKYGFCLNVCAWQFYIIRTGKLPPQEYFDKNFTYTYKCCSELYGFWKQHEDYIEKVREYMNEESFVNLVQFLVLHEAEDNRKEYFMKKYLDIAKRFIADVYYNSGCDFLPKTLMVDGW